MELLRQAVQAGYSDAAHLKADPTDIDTAIITPPEARDPARVEQLRAIAGRALDAARR